MNSIFPKAQRYFQPLEFKLGIFQRSARCPILIFYFLKSSATSATNFNSVEAQRISAIAKGDFCTKLKRNVSFANKFTRHVATSTFLQF